MVVLYPIVSGAQGRVAGEFPVGKIAWDGGSVTIHCRDRAIRERLEQLFFKPLVIRTPLGNYESALGHRWEELASGHRGAFLRMHPAPAPVEPYGRLRGLDFPEF